MQKTVKKISYYSCGYCTNNLKLVYKNQKKELRDFPAGVFLIKHETKGYILFDTGYSLDIYNCGIVGKLYNLLNPTFVKDEDLIINQLKKDNINVEEINYIILSHLHPDHVGGLKYFKNSKIIISEESLKEYKKVSFRSLIIKKLFPSWFLDNLLVIDNEKLSSKKYEYFSGYDLFNDNSIVLSKFDGHAKGQLCALINVEYLLGADSCWGIDLIEKSKKLKLLSKIIQNNINDYNKSLEILSKIRDDKKIKIYFTHDKFSSKEIL